MKDREFLFWIHARLTDVHGEDELVDYMHKLRSVALAIPENQDTPNICRFNRLKDAAEYLEKEGGSYRSMEEKTKTQLILTCPVHGEYEVTHNQKTCPACLTQAALYCQVEMDGVDALKPTDRKKQLGDCLDEAKRTICGARQDVYGNPENSFSLIARYWNIYLSGLRADGWSPPLEPKDISHMMILFKMARVQGQAPSYDNYVDLCGYAGIAADGFNSPKRNETKEDR